MHASSRLARRPTCLWRHGACLLALLTASLGSLSSAQTERQSITVWRCGPEGRDLRDAPCPEGPHKPDQRLHYDQPAAAQRKEASQIAQREARLARQLERERLALEATPSGRAAGIHGHAGPAALPQAASAPKPAFSSKASKTYKPRTEKPRPPASPARPASG